MLCVYRGAGLRRVQRDSIHDSIHRARAEASPHSGIRRGGRHSHQIRRVGTRKAPTWELFRMHFRKTRCLHKRMGNDFLRRCGVPAWRPALRPMAIWKRSSGSAQRSSALLHTRTDAKSLNSGVKRTARAWLAGPSRRFDSEEGPRSMGRGVSEDTRITAGPSVMLF